MKKIKNRLLSLLLSAAVLLSMVPSALASGTGAQATAAGDSIIIQEQSITTAATSVTVQVTGYENLSKAKLTLNMGPEGTASDWGMSNPPRISLGSKTYTGASSYTFSIDPSKLIAGQNIQAFLYYWSDTKEDWTYAYGNAVEITDGPVVPSAAITTSPVTNRVTQLEVTLKNLPASGIFRIVQLDAGETYDSAKLNNYTSLYFALLANLTAGENQLTLSASPAAGKQLMAVIRDSSGADSKDYASQPVTVTAEKELSIVSVAGSVDSLSTQVTVNLTRVPSSGVLKVIELDAGAEIPATVFNYDYEALYTGYFYSAGLTAGENTITLTKSPTAGKVLYAVARESSGSGNIDHVSEGVTVAAAYTPFEIFIKGALTDQSTQLSVFPRMKRSSDTPSVLSGALLCRVGEDGAADTAQPIASAAAPAVGQTITFTGLSDLTAGEKLAVVLTYDGGRTAQSIYTVCDADEADSFEILETSFTPDSTTVTVKVSGYHWYNNRNDWSRICITAGKASQTQPGDDEGREDLASQVFTGKGTYTFTIPADKKDALVAGDSIMAALRFYDGNGIEGINDREYYAAADTKLISQAAKTPLERLANCSVTLMKDGQPRTETFKQEQTTVDYAVTLDDEIPSATLGIYAYPGTVGFDPDGNHKLTLGSTKVTGSGSGTLEVNLSKVPVGYRVIASLYVCIDGNDWYRHVNSAQTPEVVDENGQGFQDYTYPDATIDEKELQAGATSLHISLTGDARLFQAAKEGRTTISVAVGQYPADESFDFEGTNQIPMLQALSVKEAFSGKEVTFPNQPLKAGYRVRAVVYWTQNVDLYLAPGNDYESRFNKRDDSVLISGTPEEGKPAVAVKGGSITEGASSAAFTVSGTVPSGSLLLVKQYDAETTAFTTQTGTLLGNATGVTAGDRNVNFTAQPTAGKKVVAFLLKNGELQARSAAVTVKAKSAALFTVTPTGTLTAESTSLPFTVTASDASKDINAVYLFKTVNGKIADYDKPLATVRKANLVNGAGTFTIQAGTLTAGDALRIAVQYWKDDELYYFEACDLTVAGEQEADSMSIQETGFTVDSTTVTVKVTGYDAYKGYYLILTTGSVRTNGDADSRDRIGSQKYTGSDTYTFTIPAGKLTGGNTVQAYLYRYDGNTEKTYYAYSNAVAIEREAVTPEVSIVTRSITTDTTAVYVSAKFDGSALLALYTYTGDSFDPKATEKNRVGIQYLSSAPDSPQKITITGALSENDKLVAVLWTTLDETVLAQSAPVTVGKAPEKEPPAAYLLDQKVTAGMTKVAATMKFDSSVRSADYKLYQFEGETLDPETAQVLYSGSLYRSATNQDLYVGAGKLKSGSKLQLVLTAGGQTAQSNIITVQPSPDWGTPYAAFSVSAVKSDAESVTVSVDYSDAYLTMGDEFYCDVTVYACSGEYTDDKIKDQELWENYKLCRAVAKANSRQNAQTKGELTLRFYASADLKAEEKLFIKLRLPHTEWKGEEVDYLSASIPVLGAEDEIPAYQVVLYNLGEDTSRGSRLRTILSQLNIPVQEMTYARLNESVGYLAGFDSYEAAETPYTGKDYSAEFMLICNLPETLLDRFLDAMQANGLRIDHKAVVTAYNRDACYYELMDEIADEHSVFQMLIQINNMITESKKLSAQEYGTSTHWNALQTAITAGETLIRSEDPSYDDMSAAYETLKAEYLAVTSQQEIAGTAAIAITKEQGGTYTMTASVVNGVENAAYTYAWSNGQTGATVTGIAADALIGTTVTVTGRGLYGKLTGQLKVPAYEAPAVSADRSTVTVQLKAAQASVNTPAATEYVVELWQNGTLLESKRTVDAGSITFSGLTAGTAYTVKSYGVSPVGRSDILTQSVSTAAASSPSGGGSSSSSSSGGGGGSSSDRDNSGSGTVKTETTKNNDGSTTRIETKKDGTKIQTVTGKDGSVSKTETKKDGSSVTENKAADGSTGTVKTDKNGKTEAAAKLSDKAVSDAKKNGEPVKAPVEVEASRNSNTAPTVKIELPRNSGETKVEIPVSNVKPGTVAVLVHADGTEEIVKNSLSTENGIQLTVNGGATVKIVDNSKDFADTRAHWAKDAIDFVSARGLVNGMNESTFSPNAPTTRAQLWTILARQNDADLNGGATWFENAQNWAKAKGISDGANPNSTINRAQMVTMLWRAMGEPAAVGGASFADVPADSYYARAVAWAVENGITAGVGGGRFDPNATCTRGQIAAFLYRYMK